MMRRAPLLVCFLSILSVGWLPAQITTESQLAELAEALVSQKDDDSSYEEVLDQLLLRFTEPLDLNAADAEDLRMLYFFTEDQITAILQHRKQSGPFISVLELQAIKDFDASNLRKWMPFLCVRSAFTVNWKNLPHRILYPAQAYFGYRSDGALLTQLSSLQSSDSPTTFPGSSWSGSFRLRVTHNNDFSLGWNAERDRGEKFLWDPSRKWYGFDFNSFHFQVLNKPGFKNLIIGDYTASFGQGLILGGGFRVGKGAETITALRRAGNGFRPYGSLGESGFFRGVASSIPVLKNLSLNILFSKVNRDGRIRYTADSTRYISTLASSGIHRSFEELQTRKTWSEMCMAVVTTWKSNHLDGGLVFNRQIFSTPVQPQASVYNRFSFKGQYASSGSIFLNGHYRNWSAFSELGISRPTNGLGWIVGLLGSLTPEFDLSLLARSYEPDFQTFYGSSFSESTNATNEQGVYLGWKYRKGRKIQLAGYSDYFRFPYLKFRSYKPSDGVEHMIRLTKNFSRKNLISTQYRYIRKERNSMINPASFYETIPLVRQVWQVQLDYSLTERLSARTRLSATHIQSDQSLSGHMILQDLFLNMKRAAWSLRYALFAAEDYEARLYAYERDVWMSYAFPAWYGYGSRMYVVGQFRLSERLTMWMKWSAVRYADATPSSNGIDEKGGLYKADLRLQVRWML